MQLRNGKSAIWTNQLNFALRGDNIEKIPAMRASSQNISLRNFLMTQPIHKKQ
jgi:hypothetical protein